jgi:hypothetical protein
LSTALFSAIGGTFHRAAYSLFVSLGRLEGFSGRLWIIGMRLDATEVGPGNVVAGTIPKRFAADHNLGSSASFGKKLREMTGPYRARNPLLVGTLYTADAVAKYLPKRRQETRGDRPLRPSSQLGPSRRRGDRFATAEISGASSKGPGTRCVDRELVSLGVGSE